ncbi:DUF4184 family protein [Streptomyces lucensis]|uniref:DUF4184 family protein n=1 Tax=Streptomyces lucensis TaxID=67319 RepID=UPI00167341FC|nr:DUF4184 family protein [Streptomyces lucensis]
MPFTLSHAAAVLPAMRRDATGRGRLVPAVLTAGSFAPDLTYYAASVVPGAMEFGAVTHSFAGVATVDVLIAWALAGLWLLLREPLVALLPRARQGRPAALLRCGVPRARVRAVPAAWWYVSAVLGALTHVVWDAFTHHDRWGTRLIPAIGRVHPAGEPLYSWLQYASSVAGAVVIVLFLVRALRCMPGGEPVGVPVLSARDRCGALVVIGGCALAGAVQRAARWWGHRGASAGPWELVPTLCFGVGTGVLLGLFLYAVGVRVWRPGPVPGGPGEAGGPVGTVAADRGRPVSR